MAPPTSSRCMLLTLLLVSWLSQAVVSISIVSPLNVTYYATSCPQVHQVVRERLQVAFKMDRKLAASVARLLFHDCFVEVSSQACYVNTKLFLSSPFACLSFGLRAFF